MKPRTTGSCRYEYIPTTVSSVSLKGVGSRILSHHGGGIVRVRGFRELRAQSGEASVLVEPTPGIPTRAPTAKIRKAMPAMIVNIPVVLSTAPSSQTPMMIGKTVKKASPITILNNDSDSPSKD